MRATAAGMTDVGLQRDHNEDSYAVGVRWDLTKHLAIKGDFISHLKADRARDHAVRAQVAFSF